MHGQLCQGEHMYYLLQEILLYNPLSLFVILCVHVMSESLILQVAALLHQIEQKEENIR